MQLTDILTVLVAAGVFGFVFDLFGLWLTVRVLKKRIYETITSYIVELQADLTANPEKIQPIVDSLMKAGMKSLGSMQTKETYIKLPIIGKIPLSAIMPLAQPYLEKAMAGAGQNVAEKALKSPFEP